MVRVTVGRHVIQSDVYARGFQPWREEEADVQFSDGTSLSGKIWMPLERESQRLSDFMNRQGAGFFVLTTQTGLHLVNATAVARITLSESSGAPLGGGEPRQDAIAN